MEHVASASIMFDEASDIQMHKHLNVFVNVSSLEYYFFCIKYYQLILSIYMYVNIHVYWRFYSPTSERSKHSH